MIPLMPCRLSLFRKYRVGPWGFRPLLYSRFESTLNEAAATIERHLGGRIRWQYDRKFSHMSTSKELSAPNPNVVTGGQKAPMRKYDKASRRMSHLENRALHPALLQPPRTPGSKTNRPP